MRLPEHEENGEIVNTDAERVVCDLEAIEAACRALANQPGSGGRIQICLPANDADRPDLPLERIVERWGETFAVTTVVERQGELNVVLIAQGDGTEK